MPTRVADLADASRFELLRELGHNDIAAFAAEYYWQRKSWIVWAHVIFSAALLVALILVGRASHYSLDGWLTRFGHAVLSFFVLLPLHELIHGAVYKVLGATDIRYGASLRKAYAYAVAHNYVAGRRAFAWVALMPFLVINIALVVAAVTLPGVRFYLVAVLLLHTAGTSGDFAMLNFLWLHRDRDVYTYDDADAHVSYFYARRSA